MMNDSMLIALLISSIKEQQAEIANSAMVRPESDPFRTGLIAGRHQGLQMAVDALDSILREDETKEKHS